MAGKPKINKVRAAEAILAAEVAVAVETPVPFDWNTATGYQKVLYSAVAALKALGAVDKTKAQKYSIVYAKAKELFPELTAAETAVAENSFYAHLSSAVQDEDSPVNCEGPWKGYYLLPTEIAELPVVASPAPEPTPEEKTRKEREVLLYPVALNWLKAQGYRCSDTAAGRKMGKWGNPDITGLLVTETVGMTEVEIATIEVKTSFNDWEYWIFEAVAHRRFSNRAYFAFAHPEELALKLPSALRHYSELYHVGILTFLLSNELFTKLTKGDLTQPVDPSEVLVQELYSAPFMTVHAPAKKRFFEEGLGGQGIQAGLHLGKAS